MINFNKMYICPFFVILIINCSSWSKKEWNQLNNKNFYFHKFSYYEKFSSNKFAFNIIKKVPIIKILKIAEKKYNIQIDYDEFDNYLSFGKSSELKASSLFSNDDHVWSSDVKKENLIHLEFIVDSTSDPKNIKYTLYFNVNGKTRAKYINAYFGEKKFLTDLAGDMGYVMATGNSDIFIEEKTGKKVNVATSKSEKEIKQKQKNRFMSEIRIKSLIAEHTKKLSPKEKIIFRDKIIKLLYKLSE